MISASSPLKIAVLIDLPAGDQAGGHVKMWQRLAEAAALSRLPIDITLYFSGAASTFDYAPHVRAIQLPPIFSTARLRFLPYLPDHTDLAHYHQQLARHLRYFDIVHTTDAFFAFARTAEKQQQKHPFALVHSFHTDQPAYAAIFTARSLQSWLGKNWFSRLWIQGFRLPAIASWQMRWRLAKHLRHCDYVLATRPEDRAIAVKQIGTEAVKRLRLGVDKAIFQADNAARGHVCAHYNIPPGRFLLLFVGRVDEGKNIHPLLEACADLIAKNYPVHLIIAGIGPATAIATEKLGDKVTLCGFVPPEDLAKLYAAADSLAIPSEVEIGSLVLVEALASGLPVLVSAASQLADLHGPTPALRAVPANGWSAALQQLVTQPNDLPTMRAAAAAYSEQRVADWNSILRDDLYPVWQVAARQRGG